MQASRTYTGAHKIQPVKWEVTWSENGHADRVKPSADNVEVFNAILRDIAADATDPITGDTYRKTGFRITFADGEEYTGRFDVYRLGRERPLIQNHVRAFVGYHSGLIKPDHLTDEDYAAHLKVYGEETQAEWYELARKYDVGVSTPDDDYDAGLEIRLDEASPEPEPSFEVWAIDPNGDGTLQTAADTLEDAEELQERYAEHFNGSGGRLEIWRDGQQIGASRPTAMLTSETARLGQRVEVWQHPNVEPAAYQGQCGEVRGLYAGTKPYAAVALDGYGYEWTYIPLGHLIAERS